MFTLRLLRAIQIEGQRLLRGAVLQADAATARDLIEGGTACLDREADLPRLIQQIVPIVGSPAGPDRRITRRT